MNEDKGQESAPQLSLGLDNKKLAFFIEEYEKRYDAFDKKHKLTERREANQNYYFGRQLDDQNFKSYEKKFVDNVIKETEDIFRTLVLSRIPDFIVNPGVESQITREVAELISDAINKTFQSDKLKEILTISFRRHAQDLTAVIKYFWNPAEGRFGDVDWEVIPAKHIKIDASATRNDQKDMRLIIHAVEKTLADWIMLFPSKEDKLKEFARSQNWHDDKDEDGIAFDLKIQEVWFDWKQKVQDFDPENPNFEFHSGVLWKAGKGEDSVLDKRKNPNWDWEGEERLFFNGQPVSDEVLPQIALAGIEVPGIERKKMLRNFFGKPRKPFIFMGYEQYGEMAFDEISRIEENRYLQENYDTRVMQVTKMIDDSRGKHIFSGLSGLKKDTVDEMDLNNPDEDVYVEGDIRQVHAFITKEQPSTAMFADLNRTKQRMSEKLHIAGSASGELQTDTATTAQIQRESSFTVSDDFSDIAINKVSTQMAEALLHMMKLRYTPQHFQALLGNKGEGVQNRLNWDMIEDGLELSIHASGTDKLKAERQAKEEAQLGLIDPITYFKDTNRTDPENRTEMLVTFQTAPQLYIKKYAQGMDVDEIAGQVMQQNQQNLAQFGGAGQLQQPAQRPSPENTGNIPTTPQGSPRNLIGQAGSAISRIFGR